jgi:hypothetical protein
VQHAHGAANAAVAHQRVAAEAEHVTGVPAALAHERREVVAVGRT